MGWPSELALWQKSDQPLTRIEPAVTTVPLQGEWHQWASRRGVIVAGQIDSPQEALAVAALADQLGWPLLADAQSQLLQHPSAISHVDLALHDASFRHELGRAELLLQVGGRLLSKRLSQFIADHPWQQLWLLAPNSERLSPDYRLDRRLIAPIADWCQQHQAAIARQAPWHQLPSLAATLPTRQLPFIDRWSELAITHRLATLWQGALLLGNSLPPRLWQMLAPARPDAPQPGTLFSNRGASGIDGLIATAAGIARGQPSGEVTTLILGDTSALHDLNSLALLRHPSHPVVVVLLNNDGGGIFSLLPGAATLPELDACFRLDHGLDFAHAAAQFGLAYAAPTDLESFSAAYLAAQASAHSTLIECRVPAGQSASELAALAVACRTEEG